jgi:hypothetical protein
MFDATLVPNYILLFLFFLSVAGLVGTLQWLFGPKRVPKPQPADRSFYVDIDGHITTILCHNHYVEDGRVWFVRYVNGDQDEEDVASYPQNAVRNVTT